jgi:hypothetical protein
MRAAFDFGAAAASWPLGPVARSSTPENAASESTVRTVVNRFRMFV